jgi:hypothetical protein
VSKFSGRWVLVLWASIACIWGGCSSGDPLKESHYKIDFAVGIPSGNPTNDFNDTITKAVKRIEIVHDCEGSQKALVYPVVVLRPSDTKIAPETELLLVSVDHSLASVASENPRIRYIHNKFANSNKAALRANTGLRPYLEENDPVLDSTVKKRTKMWAGGARTSDDFQEWIAEEIKAPAVRLYVATSSDSRQKYWKKLERADEVKVLTSGDLNEAVEQLIKEICLDPQARRILLFDTPGPFSAAGLPTGSASTPTFVKPPPGPAAPSASSAPSASATDVSKLPNEPPHRPPAGTATTRSITTTPPAPPPVPETTPPSLPAVAPPTPHLPADINALRNGPR